MATIVKERCRVGYTISGNSPEVQWLYESAAKTHKIGAMLYMSASRRMVPLPTASGLSQADIVHGIAGLAMQDGGNYTNSTTLVPVAVANDDTVFLTNLSARQTASTSTISITHIGSTFGASVNSSRFFVARGAAAATNSLVYIRNLHDTVGDLYGRVYFQFLRAARAFRR